MERIRAFFTENLGLKLLSLILAFFLWLFVKGSMREEVAVMVPVELEKVPSTLCVRGIDPPSVTVRLRGVLNQLNRLRLEEMSARLDLSGARSGTNTFLLRPDDFSLPPGIEVLRISPSEVKVRLSPLTTKRVRVRVALRGTPAEGFSVREVRVGPPFVLLKGPLEELKGLEEVETEEVDVGGIKEDLEVEVPLRLGGLPVRCEPKKVKVKVELEARS